MTGYEIHNADVLETLEILVDHGETFDAVVTDPPYCSGGVTVAERKRSLQRKYFGNRAGTAWQFDGVQFADSMDLNALYDFTRRWLRLCWQLLTPPGYVFIFCDWRTIPTFGSCLQGAGFSWLGIVPWNKKNARPNPGVFTPVCEYVLYGAKDGKSGKHAWGLISESPPPGNERRHPTEKPVGAWDHLLGILPDAAKSVVDPFCGSASSGVAALRRGLYYCGIEIKTDYAKAANERLSAIKTAPLFQNQKTFESVEG